MSDRWTQHNMDKCGVAWFKMNEDSGNILDSKGTNVGTPYNLTYSGEDGIGFNGSSSYIEYSNKVIPIGKKSIYFEIKTTQTSVGMIMTQTDGSARNGTQVYVRDGRILFMIGKGVTGSPVITVTISTIVVNDGLWHKVLITWDGTVNKDGVKLYIDDMVKPKTTNTALEIETLTPTHNLSVGRGHSKGDKFYFNGNLRNIQIYNDVIDPIPKYYFIQTNDNKIWTYNTTWQDTGMVIGDLNYTNVSAKSNFETYGMFADENLSSQALQDLKDMGYTSYRVLMGKI